MDAPWIVTAEKVQEAVRRLVETARPIRIILFGSHAKGTADLRSDLDLLVIERAVTDRVAEMIRLENSLRGLMLPTDILVISEQDFNEWADTPGTVYREARQTGKVLYEAA